MFDMRSKNTLSLAKSLEVIQILLNTAREGSKDPEIKMVFCDYADALLGHMKSILKRPGSSSDKRHDDSGGDKVLQESVATAYLDHAILVADLGQLDLAQNSRKRADKWG